MIDIIARGLAVRGRRRALLAAALRYSGPRDADPVMTTPPTVGAFAAASAIPGGVEWPAVTTSGDASGVLSDRFSFFGGNIQASGANYPDNLFVQSKAITRDGGVQGNGPFTVEFLFDGTQLEIGHKDGGAVFRVRVDGQLVSAEGHTTGNSGGRAYLPLTFATRGTRLITIENDNARFSGVVTGPGDTIHPSYAAKPRVIVVGDSFTEGAGASLSAATSWVRRAAHSLGWADMSASGVGSTGYLNPGPGGRVKFRDRIASDVIAFAPDVWVIAGGINDHGSYAAADIGAEASALFAQLRAALPDAVGVVVGPFWRNGVETIPASLLDTRDALKAAADAAGLLWVDLLEMPLDRAGMATTLAAPVAAGAASISLQALPPVRSTVEIGTGTSRERRVVTNVSGVGPFDVSLGAGLSYNHSAGDPARTVGGSLWTGTGNVGAPTGTGNSDLLVSGDGTHPSQAGHEAIGSAVASQLRRALIDAEARA